MDASYINKAVDAVAQVVPESVVPVATYKLGDKHYQAIVMADDTGAIISPATVADSESITETINESNGLLRRLLNAILRPIWYSPSLNALRVATDTNSTVLTYQYLVYPYSGYGPGTTVWGQSMTDGLNMARTSWAVNIRSQIF